MHVNALRTELRTMSRNFARSICPPPSPPRGTRLSLPMRTCVHARSRAHCGSATSIHRDARNTGATKEVQRPCVSTVITTTDYYNSITMTPTANERACET